MLSRLTCLALLVFAACGDDPVPPLATAQPGVVFTFPQNAQVDVPIGANVVVAFSDPVASGALGDASIVGPNGPVSATATVTPDGNGLVFAAPALDPGTQYGVQIGADVCPTATNLPASGPLFSFTTRTDRPRAAPPALVAVNGGDPSNPESYRPMLDTSTIRLLFSEPLDPRRVVAGAGSVEVVDAGGTAVPALVVPVGIHVAIDPYDDLTAGQMYTVQLGASLVDLGGQALAPTTVNLTPRDTKGASGSIAQVLRTRTDSDPGAKTLRAGATANTVSLSSPLIGAQTQTVEPSALATELGDPAALGGPIAFTVRRGQRMKLSGLDVKLGGQIAAGVSTGDIEIEFLTDGGGRLYRNPYQPADQRPEDLRAPLYVDLDLDVALFATDPDGNAVLSQTVLGVEASGVVSADDGYLGIETVGAMELGLLGVGKAPSNLALSLLTDQTATADTDTTAPILVANTTDLEVDGGIELIFSEPIDLATLDLQLKDPNGNVIPTVIESHGATVVVRPTSPLAYSTSYSVVMNAVTDVAGNALADLTPVVVSTPPMATTNVPLMVAAMHPGVPCALTSGHCAGGDKNDDSYHPFTLPADEPITVNFTQPLERNTIALGTACNTGSVRVETVDGTGACSGTVPGTLMVHDHTMQFVPDVAWTEGAAYRVSLISGGNKSCVAGAVCGVLSNETSSYDPLNGASDDGAAGGPDLVMDFTGAASNGSTYIVTEAGPYTDINGDGTLDGSEQPAPDNRAGLKVLGTTGAISNASANGPFCPGTTDEGCMYISGAMPVELGALQTNCTLPDGTTAAQCIPVTLSPQIMYATSVSLKANVVVNITTDTKTSVMRLREPADGPVTGYIVDGGGTPTLLVTLDVYLDAPDMSVPLSSHDLHSKPLSVALSGPLTFLPDGRIAIAASNTADIPVTVNISAPLGISGAVDLQLPANEMKLQLVSPPLRGVSR